MGDNKRNLVIFDWDGVLADSAPFYFDVYRKICSHYGVHFPLNTVDEFRGWYDSEWEKNFISLGFPPTMIPQILEYEKSLIDYRAIDIFQDIRGQLDAFGREFHVAVASTTPSRYIEEKIEADGLGHVFEMISGGEDGLSEKKTKIGKVLEHFHARPREAVMVGDTVMDVVSANALGVRCIAVSYGWNSRKKLEAASPYIIVDRPDEVLPAVRRAFS